VETAGYDNTVATLLSRNLEAAGNRENDPYSQKSNGRGLPQRLRLRKPLNTRVHRSAGARQRKLYTIESKEGVSPATCKTRSQGVSRKWQMVDWSINALSEWSFEH